MNTQSEKPKFFSTKTDPKKNKENPNALRMNRSVQSTNHTNYNRTTITITETSTKTFLKNFSIRNMLQTNFSHAILFTWMVSRNRIIHRLRTSTLDTLEIAQLQPHGI